jgi:hypothetical protein
LKLLEDLIKERKVLSNLSTTLINYFSTRTLTKSKESRRLFKSLVYHSSLVLEAAFNTTRSIDTVLGIESTDLHRNLKNSLSELGILGCAKYKKLKARLTNPCIISNLDRFELEVQASIVSFAKLPIGHTPDFICLAPWGGLDSVIEEFEEELTLSSEDEDMFTFKDTDC